MNLEEIRKRIDDIDTQLIDLICKRMDCSRKVAEFKFINGMPVFDRSREDAILDKAERQSGQYGNAVKQIYSSMMEQSRAVQYPMAGSDMTKEFTTAKAPELVKTVACQGIKGAYSHLTAMKLYPNAEIKFCNSWEDVCAAVENGDAEYGILPVENSWAGSVHEVYDLLINGDFNISMCANAGIKHNLIGLAGAEKSDIKTVVSHHQALAQCADYIKSHGYTCEQCNNTAKAVKQISVMNDPSLAAIGSEYAAKEYGLKVIESNIASSENNTTRFVSICKTPQIAENVDKISVVLSIPHKPGAMYSLLASFAACGMNMTKLESRPIKGRQFEYLFYLDIAGDLKDRLTSGVLETVKSELPYFKLLGNYPELSITLE